MSTAPLTFESVSLTFPDGTTALDSVDLAVERGEFVAIVGPSGCGKSTLLRVASGLETATAGRVVSDGSAVGYVFQDATLLPWRTVEANVSLLAELEGMDRDERSARVRDALTTVGLTEWSGYLPRQLSGGMRMRVSLARSLVLRPGVFLFDEPFGALDEMTRERLNDELQDLFRREGFAGLFVTHSIAEAVYLSTRVVVMSPRPGRVVADIPVEFPFPRNHDLRYEAAFGEKCAEVSRALRTVDA
ncbi:MAG: ABC transporter ATP-binding protein [Ilumatobacteraceae bacterium]